ncbi:MAG: adenylate/guanylate cyclase domain-containing protein [Acidimicrobiales bacterium]
MSGDGGRAPGPPEPGDDRAEALDRVRRRLLAAGATAEEIDAAVADDVLDLLTVDRLVLPAAHRYDQEEVAALTGLPVELLRRFWRALGFLDIAPGDRVFTDLDVEAVQLLQRLVEMGAAEVETALQLARVIGSSMARIAEAELAPEVRVLGEQADSVGSAEAFAEAADTVLPAMARLLEFVWRRHMQAATRRTMLARTRARSGQGTDLVVGFADMVGFTLLSQHLSEAELAAVVRRFEDISHDTVTGLGGRVVKMIGDEVMFVVDDVAAAARIGLSLAEAYADDDLLSDVRVGLAVGPVLVREGDYYGAAVNLAHRIVNIANPGTVLVADELYRRLQAADGSEGFAGRPLRPRELKDLGRVQLWWLGRAGQDLDGAGTAADRRRNLRWERLADVLRDLEELRGVGERVLSGRRAHRHRPAGASGAGEADGGDAVRA